LLNAALQRQQAEAIIRQKLLAEGTEQDPDVKEV